MQANIKYAENWERHDDGIGFEEEKKTDNSTKAEINGDQKGVSYVTDTEQRGNEVDKAFFIGPSVSEGQGRQTKPATYDNFDQKSGGGTPPMPIGPDGKS